MIAFFSVMEMDKFLHGMICKNNLRKWK